MAYTLRNVDRYAHTPKPEKLLSGEPGKGIGSVKRMAKEAEAAKISADFKKAPKERAESEAT